MKKSRLLGAVCATIFGYISTLSHAALVDNGNGLIYDTVLNITWSQPDATSRNWDDANTWVGGLTLGGVSGWRLPYMSVTAGVGPVAITGDVFNCITATELECRDNELGYMFYQNLGGTFNQSILTSSDPDLALFPTLQSSSYWSGTESDSSDAWGLNFASGGQFRGSKNITPFFSPYSWAVHDGNVGASAVPLPPALWLFGSGLLGLIGTARRRVVA